MHSSLNSSNMKVLVVDDEPSVRTSLGFMLEQSGVGFAEASGGDAAIAALERERFDAVVLDILMPDKDGLETLVEIRKRWPDTRVVSMSGGGFCCDSRSNLRISLVLGAVSALEKPFALTALLAAIREDARASEQRD